MLFAKLFNASNNISSAIRSGYNQGFHATCINLWRVCVACFTGTNTGTSFKANIMPKFCNAYLFTGFGGERWNICSAVDVKSLFTKGLKLIKPVLLTLNLKHRQYQFKHIKDKCFFSVLVPSVLHRLCVMLIVSERPSVLVFSRLQVGGTTNIKSACNNAGNTVNAGCLGYVAGKHVPNCLSLVPCLFRCQGNKAIPFSSRLITPPLGNTSTIAFSARGQKAEEFAREVA